jgi:hypothetical protein
MIGRMEPYTTTFIDKTIRNFFFPCIQTLPFHFEIDKLFATEREILRSLDPDN